MGLIIHGSGILGVIIFAVLADRTKRILTILWICAICTFSSLLGLSVVLMFDKQTYLQVLAYILSFLLGTFGIVFVPLCNEIAAEVKLYRFNRSLTRLHGQQNPQCLLEHWESLEP